MTFKNIQLCHLLDQLYLNRTTTLVNSTNDQVDLKAAIDNFKIPTRPRLPKKIQMILSSEDNGLLMPLGVDYFCHT